MTPPATDWDGNMRHATYNRHALPWRALPGGSESEGGEGRLSGDAQHGAPAAVGEERDALAESWVALHVGQQICSQGALLRR